MIITTFCCGLMDCDDDVASWKQQEQLNAFIIHHPQPSLSSSFIHSSIKPHSLPSLPESSLLCCEIRRQKCDHQLRHNPLESRKEESRRRRSRIEGRRRLPTYFSTLLLLAWFLVPPLPQLLRGRQEPAWEDDVKSNITFLECVQWEKCAQQLKKREAWKGRKGKEGKERKRIQDRCCCRWAGSDQDGSPSPPEVCVHWWSNGVRWEWNVQLTVKF